MSAKSGLIFEVPHNLSFPNGVHARYCDSDVYDICRRVREISPFLSVLVNVGQEDKFTHTIIEEGRDGVERMVFRVGPAAQIKELDGAVIHKLKELFSVDFTERVRKLEEENDKYEREYKLQQQEELYEKVGRPMWTELERCGFIQRPVSYPKSGVTGGKGSKAKS